jgi:Holliday junction resolvase RusA-like endonuclease
VAADLSQPTFGFDDAEVVAIKVGVRPSSALLDHVQFTVRGTPRPQGSKRAFRNKYTGHIQQVESSPDIGAWRDTIALAADIAMAGRSPLEGPVRLTVEFRFQRPASHRGAKGLRPSAPAVHHQRPDASKLVRALEDALTTIAWRDDSQVAQLLATKVWDDEAPAGASVNVEVLV